MSHHLGSAPGDVVTVELEVLAGNLLLGAVGETLTWTGTAATLRQWERAGAVRVRPVKKKRRKRST